MCCSIDLNNLMEMTYTNVTVTTRTAINGCNIGLISNRIQQAAEAKYKKRFEVITGIGDFAEKVNFIDNLVCKIEIDGKYVFLLFSVDGNLSNVHQ